LALTGFTDILPLSLCKPFSIALARIFAIAKYVLVLNWFHRLSKTLQYSICLSTESDFSCQFQTPMMLIMSCGGALKALQAPHITWGILPVMVCLMHHALVFLGVIWSVTCIFFLQINQFVFIDPSVRTSFPPSVIGTISFLWAVCCSFSNGL
jgi:hypothetical protein